MRLRQVGALVLMYLTACAGVPRARYAVSDPAEAALEAAGYELHVLSEDDSPAEPVEVAQEEFQRAMRRLAQGIVRSEQPMEEARLLMEGGLRASLLAEVERGQVKRLSPQEEGSPLDASDAAEYRRRYLGMCQQQYGGGDCLGLLADGPTLTREDLRVLALALALKQVLRETGEALKGLVSPQAVVGMVVCTAYVYLLLWLLPEPVSKLVAASLTVALLAWLPVHTLWSLMDGWAALVHEVDGATSYEEIEGAGEKFSKLMGENTARVVVMLVTTALAGRGAELVAKLPRLPGFARAAARAEAQGMSLAEAGNVEAVAAAEEGTFTLMVRRPGGRAAAAAEEAAEARQGITTIIHHRGGNRQVLKDGTRWHVPANRSTQEIPAKDPVGDALQTAAQRVANQWNRSRLSPEQAEAIKGALAREKYWRAKLMERMFRGQWVEKQLRRMFPQLSWRGRGVDAIDPATGYEYEVLSGTVTNMERHGRRMAEELFRLITF